MAACTLPSERAPTRELPGMQEREHPADIVLSARRGIRGAVGKRPGAASSLAKNHPPAAGKVFVVALSQDGWYGHPEIGRQSKRVGFDGDRMLPARLHHDFRTVRQSGADYHGLTPRHVRPHLRRFAKAGRYDAARSQLGLRQLATHQETPWSVGQAMIR